MLTLLFLTTENLLSIFSVVCLIWLFGVTVKLGVFALKAGWGIMRILLSVVFLPLTILGLLISGIITLTVPVLVIIGFVTVGKLLIGERV